MHVYVFIYMHIYSYMCMCLYICIYTHVYINMCLIVWFMKGLRKNRNLPSLSDVYNLKKSKSATTDINLK